MMVTMIESGSYGGTETYTYTTYLSTETTYSVSVSSVNFQEPVVVEKKQPNFARFQNDFKRRGR